MEVFESTDSNGKTLLFLDKKESRLLVEMCESASQKNKRKSTWKKMSENLSNSVACY